MISLATLASASAALHGSLSGTSRGAAPPPAKAPSPPDKPSRAGSAQTSSVTNADGSTTVTVTSGTGSIVSIATSGGNGNAPQFVGATAGPYTVAGGTAAPSLLSLLV